MNLDDLACVGAVDNILVSSTIGRNKRLIPGQVVQQLIRGTERLLEQWRSLGIQVQLTGGETADVGDLVRTVIVDSTVVARMERDKVIALDKVAPGDWIVGFASGGEPTSYESGGFNGGMGSNGLTSARHDVLHKVYGELYPESFDDKGLDESIAYIGSKRLTDKVKVSDEEEITVGKLILAPTRTYLPVLRQVYAQVSKEKLHGVVHCSGGGQTKILHFAKEGLHIIKDNLFDLPILFKMIQEESNSDWREMYKVFNMGHRMELYCADQTTANQIIQIANSFNLEAKIVGRVEAHSGPKKLTISSAFGVFEYDN